MPKTTDQPATSMIDDMMRIVDSAFDRRERLWSGFNRIYDEPDLRMAINDVPYGYWAQQDGVLKVRANPRGGWLPWTSIVIPFTEVQALARVKQMYDSRQMEAAT